MAKLKSTKKYYFSVEGETEQWYLKWLQDKINENVIDAVNRAKFIMQCNKENGYVLQMYKGYKYYKENPSLAIWEVTNAIIVS